MTESSAELSMEDLGEEAGGAEAEMERRLWETENRFRTMADTAPVLLWMACEDGLCDFFNQGWLEFTGRSMSQELGTGWAEGVHPEDFQRCMQTYFDAFVDRRPFSLEYRLRRRDGEYRWMYDQGAPRFDADGRFVGFIGSCVDVTLQKRATEALASMNRHLEERVRQGAARVSEREMLLREVHHRVKNDLQLISSLLSMQGREFAGSAPARAIEECQARVQAIARIHEHMYQSRELTHMSLSEHLRVSLASVMLASAAAGRIELEFDASENVIISVDRAIPCAMMVHELVTNALKHAFPDGRRGSVRVVCRREQADRVSLVVEDDGIGLPSQFDEKRAYTLGWTLINAFVRQICGSLELRSGPGTHVGIRFVDGSRAVDDRDHNTGRVS